MDIRASAARFYDLTPHAPRDLDFYRALVPSPAAAVLELGCGTGRVTVPLAAHCGFIRGIDRSPAMLDRCRDRLQEAGIPPARVEVSEGDITDFDLDRQFDLVIAPFRVLQNLETDAQVGGLLHAIRRHLAPGGTAVLNAFRPSMPPDALRSDWVRPGEQLTWTVPVEGGRVECWDRRPRIDPEMLVVYPELVYRRFEGDRLAEEAVLHIAMRCWYPDTFEALIAGHGFQIVGRWGGYAGEVYGEGPELVLAFQ